MPRFIDHHAQLPVPPPDQLAMLRERVNGPPDERGVKGINIFFAKDGSGYCLFEAPDAAAVVRTHEASGVPVTQADVMEVTALM